MASYHFRIKSDKKPNGKKIIAAVHVDYIFRQGEYDEEKNLETNLITTKDYENIFGEKTAPLYLTDDFGKIFSATEGISISGKYSQTTLAIALELVKTISENQALILKGSQKFKEKILQAAVASNLETEFEDENLQEKFLKLKESKKNGDKKYVESGGKIIKPYRHAKPDVKKLDRRTIGNVTDAGFCLQTLSAKFVDDTVAAKTTGVLLSSNEFDNVDEIGKAIYPAVRWDLSDEQRKLAERTAQTILKNIETEKEKNLSASHYEYISRESAFAKRGDCIFRSHQLPKWAKDNPKKFFHAADKYEGEKNRRYVEIEFSLPNELTTLEQYKKIIDKFLENHLSDHYYAYAIHEKIGTMSNEQRHPHVHIMFSERLIDEVEKIRERSPENYFKYPARKKTDGNEPTFEEKFQRGAPRDRKWTLNSSHTTEIRADFAKIQNEVLEENGFSIRVDHRSLKAQKAEAEKFGDTFLAKLFDREAEKYLGVEVPTEENNPRVSALKKYREQCRQQAEILYAADLVLRKSKESELKKTAEKISVETKKLLSSDEIEEQTTEEIKFLREQILSLSKEVNAWRRTIITAEKAEEQAKFEYMTKAEYDIWKKFQETKLRIDSLKKFLTNLKEPPSYQTESLTAYKKIRSGVEEKIRTLNTAINFLQPSISRIEKRLQKPELKKNIELAAHNILRQNFFVREKLKTAMENLNQTSEKLRDKIFMENPKQEIFSTKEVYDILRRQYFDLKKEQDKLSEREKFLQSKIITPARAMKMAENIFVKGDWKKYRATVREFEKKKNLLTEREIAIIQKNLEAEKNRLEIICTKSHSKIEEIAAGILRKNQKYFRQFEETRNEMQKNSGRIKHLANQLQSLKNRLDKEKTSHFFKVVGGVKGNQQKNISTATTIADAIMSDPKAVSLVAHSSGKDLEMEKSWELMSELEKDEMKLKNLLSRI